MRSSHRRSRIVRWQDSAPQNQTISSSAFGDNLADFVLWSASDTANCLNRVTIHRVVGFAVCWNSGATAQFYKWAIKAADFDINTNSPSDKMNLSSYQSAGMPLMGWRFGYVQATGTGAAADNQGHSPYGSYFDIRTKRVLKSGQGLALWTQCSTATAVQMYLSYRILYSFQT